MTNVFIIGSCVSRDAWEIADGSNFKIVDYVARTSFASAFAEPYELPLEVEVKSEWQKRMLEIDCNKSLEERIRSSQFDIILVDLIDERFEVFKKDGSVATNSFAFRGASLGNRALKQGYAMLSMDDPIRGSMWTRGWTKLYQIALETNPDCLIVMNQVQWGSHPDMPAEAKPEMTETANRVLRSFYRVGERVTGDRFRSITYDAKHFAPDANHKWGIGPYHYGKSFYEETISKLSELAKQIPRGERPQNLSKAPVKNQRELSISRFPAGPLSPEQVQIVRDGINRRLGVSSYRVDGEYLTFSRANILRNAVVSLDSTSGLPINKTIHVETPHFNPTTIGYFGLESLSKYIVSKNESDLDSAKRVADFALSNINEQGIWPSPYEHHWFKGRSGGAMPEGRPSALNQGYLISLLSRLHLINGDNSLIECAVRALQPFMVSVENGGIKREFGPEDGLTLRLDGNSFYEEYPTPYPSLVLNGFIFALFGLYDLWKVSGSEVAKNLYTEGERTLEKIIPHFDLGNNSCYDLTHLHSSNWMTPPNVCRAGYHHTHLIELSAMSHIESSKYDQIYCRWLMYASGSCVSGN